MPKGRNMTYDETSKSRITPRQAVRELDNHGVTASVRGNYVIECDTGNLERIVEIGRDGCVSGRTILDWMGY